MNKTIRFKILNWSDSHSFSCCPTLKPSPPLMCNHTGTVLPIVQMWGGGSKEWERERVRNVTCFCTEYNAHSLHEFRAALKFECVGGFMSCVIISFIPDTYIFTIWISTESIFYNRSRTAFSKYRKPIKRGRPGSLHCSRANSEKLHL